MGCALLLVFLGTSLAAPEISDFRRSLASAVDALHSDRTEEAARILVGLHAENPGQDDVAYWLARLQYEAGRDARALDLLAGREGDHLPACRFRTLEARAWASQGKLSPSRTALEPCRSGPDPEASLLWGLAAWLRWEAGEEAGAIEAMRRCGGHPWAVLDAPLQAALPGAASLRLLEIGSPWVGRIQVGIDGENWEVDLSTGLARHAPRPAPPVGPSQSGARSEIVSCGQGVAWSSPAEPLADNLPGVYRSAGGSVERLARSPAPGTDDRPSCAGNSTWFVRRVEGHSVLMEITAGRATARNWEGGGLTGVDAREVGGTVELLLGRVVEGRTQVWVTKEDPWAPVLLLDSLGIAPRWAP